MTAPDDSARPAWGFGLATYDAAGELLDIWFPDPQLGRAPREDYHAPASLCALEGHDSVREVDRTVLHVLIDDLDAALADRGDVWLRLHLLSHRLVQPRGLNLDGVFGLLANVAWTNLGACAVDGFEQTRLRAREPVKNPRAW